MLTAPARAGQADVPKVRDAIRLIESDGWRLARTRGSLRQYRHPDKPGTVTVPGHPGTCFNLVGEQVGRGFGGSLSTVESSGDHSAQAETPRPSRSLVSLTRPHCPGAGAAQVYVEPNDDESDCDRTLTTPRCVPAGPPLTYDALPVSSSSCLASSYSSQ